MNTTAIAATTAQRHGVGFRGILRSELLKLLSLPSTWWAYAVLAGISIGVSAQVSAATDFAWYDGEISQAGMQAAGVQAVGLSTDLGVLIVSVLGVLVVAGEYSTGMIRSTFTAVPRRTPVLVAKFLVFAVVTAFVGFVALAIAVPISVALLAGNGVQIRLDDPDYWRAMGGSVVYLVGVGLIAFGLGAVVRNIVGGVAAAVGIMFVVPIALGFVGSLLESQVWLRNLASFLPFNLGRALYSHPGYPDFASPGEPLEQTEGIWILEPWHGALGLAAWALALFAVAVVLLRRRDV
jgi:ABC-2 type transport system permease protein